jgi:VanZ family protein
MPPPPRTRLRGRLWSPVVFYCALIFGLSSLSSVPSMSGGSDKLAHTLLYAGLGWLLARAASGGGVRPPSAFTVFVVVGFAAAYGLSDEIHQMFVPLRHFDPRDLAADVVGAGAGAGAWWLWGILRRTRDVV